MIPYSERTQVVKFQSSNSPAKNGYEIIAGGGYTSLVKTHGGASCEVSIQGGTPENAEIKVKYTHGAITGAYDIVTLKVVRIPKEFIKDCTDIPISIAIMEDSSFIRSEPTKTTGGKYVRVNGQLGISSDTSTKYSDNAYTLVKKDILDNAAFVQNANGSNVWGLVDGTGAATIAELNLTEEQRATIVRNYLTYKGSSENPDDYRLLPYVIKVEMTKGSTKPNKGAGWFVDCVVVRKNQYTVSYQANLSNGYEIESGALPDGTVVNAGSSVEVGSTDIVAKKKVTEGSGGQKYTAVFKGWKDQYGNTYNPGDSISNIQKDYILYAIWEYPDQSLGDLEIEKTVVNAATVGEPSATQEFRFKLDLGGLSGENRYAVMNAEGQTVSTSTIRDQGSLSLKDGQYAIIYDLPKDTAYTVTEINIPEGYEVETNPHTGSIVAGNTAQAAFINTWKGIYGDLTVSKTIPEDTTGDRTREFGFSISNAALAGKNIGDLTFDENGTASFSLKHGENRTISGLPVGLKYVITETDAEGYVVTWKLGEGDEQEGNTASVTLEKEGAILNFINAQNSTPPTGIDLYLSTGVHAIILAVVLLLAAMLYFVIMRRHRRDRYFK